MGDHDLEVVDDLGQTRKASIGVSDNTYPIIDPRELEGKMAQFMNINLSCVACNLCDRVEIMRRMLKITNAVSEYYTKRWPDEPECEFVPDVSLAEIRTHAGNRMKIMHMMALRKATLVEEIANLESHKCDISMRYLRNMTEWTEEGSTPIITIATAMPPMIHEILEFPGIQRVNYAKQTCINRDGKLYIDVANVKERVMQEVRLTHQREKQLAGIKSEGVDLDQEPGYAYGAMGSTQRGVHVKPTEAPHAGTSYDGMSKVEWMTKLSGAVAEFAHTGHEEMRKPENQIKFLGKLSVHLREGERKWIKLSPWSQAKLLLHAAGYVDVEYMMELIGTYLKMAKVDARELCVAKLARLQAFVMQEIPLTKLNMEGAMECDPERYSWKSTEVPQVSMAVGTKELKESNGEAGTEQIKMDLLAKEPAPSETQTDVNRRGAEMQQAVARRLHRELRRLDYPNRLRTEAGALARSSRKDDMNTIRKNPCDVCHLRREVELRSRSPTRDNATVISRRQHSASGRSWREKRLKNEGGANPEQTQPKPWGNQGARAKGVDTREMNNAPAYNTRAARIRRIREEYENQRHAHERKVKEIQAKCDALRRELAAIGGTTSRRIGTRERQSHIGFPAMAWSRVIRNLRGNELDHQNAPHPGSTTRRSFPPNARGQRPNLTPMPPSFRGRRG